MRLISAESGVQVPPSLPSKLKGSSYLAGTLFRCVVICPTIVPHFLLMHFFSHAIFRLNIVQPRQAFSARWGIKRKKIDDSYQAKTSREKFHPTAHSMSSSSSKFPYQVSLIQAVEQFNAGAYFACHETLEKLCLSENEPTRDLYKGIL